MTAQGDVRNSASDETLKIIDTLREQIVNKS